MSSLFRLCNTQLQAAILLVITLGLVACGQNEKSSSVIPKVVIVKSISPSSLEEHRHYAGKLRAKQRALLSFEISGPISDIHVALGDTFNAGDVLAELDSTRASINLRSKQAELANARATLVDAQLEYQRKSKVSVSGAIATSSLDQSKARMDSSQAAVETAIAGVQDAQKQIADLSLIAPFNGEVVNRFVEPSQVTSAGQSIVEVLGTDNGLEVVVFIPSATRQRLSVNDDASFRLVNSGRVQQAVVTEIGSQANSAGLFPITIESVDAIKSANAGESVEVDFALLEKQSLNVPQTAYGFTPDERAYVYVVRDQTAIQTFVTLGRVVDSQVEIVSGLMSGDIVVTKGVDLLRDGQRVEPVQDTTKRFGT